VIRLGFLLILIFNIGCSAIKIHSTSKVDVSMSEREEYTKEIEFEVDKEFFLYGLVPTTHSLNVDKFLKDAGVDSISELKVIRMRKAKNIAWSLFTLGFYTPETYLIKGKTYSFKK
jgi:hypothetical protein